MYPAHFAFVPPVTSCPSTFQDDKSTQDFFGLPPRHCWDVLNANGSFTHPVAKQIVPSRSSSKISAGSVTLPIASRQSWPSVIASMLVEPT